MKVGDNNCGRNGRRFASVALAVVVESHRQCGNTIVYSHVVGSIGDPDAAVDDERKQGRLTK